MNDYWCFIIQGFLNFILLLSLLVILFYCFERPLNVFPWNFIAYLLSKLARVIIFPLWEELTLWPNWIFFIYYLWNDEIFINEASEYREECSFNLLLSFLLNYNLKFIICMKRFLWEWIKLIKTRFQNFVSFYQLYAIWPVFDTLILNFHHSCLVNMKNNCFQARKIFS